MKRQIIFIFFCCLAYCTTGCSNHLSGDSFTVKSVVNGNTIQLKNGYLVTLIGVRNAKQSETALQEIVGKKVNFKFDSSLSKKKMKKEKHLYAYIRFGKRCINSELIATQHAFELHFCLHDSLSVYRRYAGNN